MKSCARCGKGTHIVVSRSHSMVKTRRRQRPNLQRALYEGRRLLLCTSCIGVVTKQPTRPTATEKNVRGVV